MKSPVGEMSRRQFMRQGASAGAFAMGSTAFFGSARSNQAASVLNPFAYDVEQLSKTDPALVKYAQVGSIFLNCSTS